MEFDLSQKATDERLREFADKLKDLSRQIGFKVSARGWCFKPDALVNTTDSLKEIKEIKKGMKVLSYTKKTQYKKAIDTYESRFYGDLVSIKAYHLLPMTSTPEHPIAIVSRESCGRPETYKYSDIEWLPAHKIKEGIFEIRKKRHNLCYMINRKIVDDNKIDVDLCTLLGYYIAEGSIIFNDKGNKLPKAVEFTLNINKNDIALDIQRIAMECFNAKTTITDRPSQNTKRVFVYSAKLSRLLIKLAGRIAWEKKLHPSLMYLPPAKQFMIYHSARLCDGYSNGNYHHYYTTSRKLALQFQQILFRNNQIGSLIAVPNGKFAKRDLYILTMCDSDRHIGEIRGDLFITPISSISKEHYEGKVYNFAVEDTQNYGIQYILVHNCYQMETERLINKDEFDKVESWINKCRRKGILPIDFTAEEEGRKFSCVDVPDIDTPIEDLRYWVERTMTTGDRYGINWWLGETYYIQMLVEKVDLKTLFLPVCEKYHIAIATSKGWSSMLQRGEYARRFKEAEDKGLTCVLLYCLHPDQIILHNNGYSIITDITKNQKILGKTDYISVNEVMTRDYSGDIYNINATCLLPITVTAEHPMMVADIQRDNHPQDKKSYRKYKQSEFIEAKSIKEGQFLEITVSKLKENDQIITFEVLKKHNRHNKVHKGKLILTKGLARLMGFYLGNGSHSGATTLTFNAKQKDKIERYRVLVKEELGYNVGLIEQNGALQMRFGGTVTERIFRQNLGKYARIKTIPEFIFNAKKDIVSEFIYGYFEADGCYRFEKDKKVMRISTCSEGLALQLQMLIIGKYNELISLFKQERKGTYTTIQGRTTQQLDKYEMHIYHQTLAKIFNWDYNKKQGRKKWFVENGHIYVPITKITKKNYTGKVYNFNTTDHTISINNATSHNCGDHDPDGLRISDCIRKNLADLRNIKWEDGEQGYNPANLTIRRFGLDASFIDEHGLTWIDNLKTGSGGELARVVDGKFVAGLTKNGKPHKNFNMPYLQRYLHDFGVKKCEANAIIPMPEIARNFVGASITDFLGDDALARFEKKRRDVIKELSDFKEKTGLQEALQTALALIDEEKEE